MTRKRLMLVSMPFGPLFRPSIGLSLLAGSVADLDVECDIRYFTLDLAEQIGDDYYVRIADGEPTARVFLGEWLFSGTLFETSARNEAYLEHVLNDDFSRHGDFKPVTDEYRDKIQTVREIADSFVDECLREVIAQSPDIVGFTSTFQQHVASLALAKRIKSLRPETVILFGGSNCDGVMGAETIRQFDCVDVVVSGEADLVFRDVIQRILDGSELEQMPGVYTRLNVAEKFAVGQFDHAPRVQDMDTLPYLDYDEYFEQLSERNKNFERQTPDVLFETSRGCWWGEKSHCTFCGLNGVGMQFRSKSPERALDELNDLARRYPGCTVNVVDNILDMQYFHNFIPALAEQKNEINLFYETKANLKKSQLRLMKDAGIHHFQPGIESLSTNVLNLMAKGVSAIQNIQLLKWSTEIDIWPFWNILWGFPGETEDDYRHMAELIPLISHLAPPIGTGPIHIDRFSPNYNQADEYGFTNIRPFEAYQYIYDLPDEIIPNIAYYFTYDYKEPRNVEQYTQPVLNAVREWKSAHSASAYFYTLSDSQLHLWDFRLNAPQRHTILTGLTAHLYPHLDHIQSVASLSRLAQEELNETVTDDDIQKSLSILDSVRAVVQDGSQYLGLAIPFGDYKPKEDILEKFFYRKALAALTTPQTATESAEIA